MKIIASKEAKMKIPNFPLFIFAIALLSTTLLSGCSGKYDEELKQLVQTYNKIKTPVNVDEITAISRSQNLTNINEMSQANVFLKFDSSHLHTAIGQALESSAKEKDSPLKNIALGGTTLEKQALIVNFLFDEFHTNDAPLMLSGAIDVYAIPEIKDGNVTFTIVASDLSLKKLTIADDKFSVEETPIAAKLIETAVNALLPYISNLIPKTSLFDETLKLAEINPDELFEGVKCLSPEGQPKQVVADILQSAVVITPAGLEIVAFAASRLIEPPNASTLSHGMSTTSIMNELATADKNLTQALKDLKTRTFDPADTSVNETFAQSNYAVIGDYLIAYVFSLLGKDINYSVSGKPCVEPVLIDTKLEAENISRNCKKISNCRTQNARALQCDAADRCKRGLHCKSGCGDFDLICKTEKFACEAHKSTKILACYAGKGVNKLACETIKAAANTACVGLNPDEILSYPVDCGIAAALGADNMGSVSGKLTPSTNESSLTIKSAAIQGHLESIQVIANANISAQVSGRLTISPTGALGTALTCIIPTTINVKQTVFFNDDISLVATRGNIEVKDDQTTVHQYTLQKNTLKVRLSRSMLEDIILRNPEFALVCQGATLLGLIDSATGGDSGKNTMEMDIDSTLFEMEIQPLIWRFGETEYRVPIAIGRMTNY